ncbi:MAG: LysM peptidoglycan-binding domain-containing protein [Bacteroidetes bacterium]|nr:LysM peptidoglycan-binding domain-containing protein [Bacteroidota bacterium]
MKTVFWGLLLFMLPFFLRAQDNALTKKDTAETRFLNQRKFYLYKPDKGETLYGIAKKFNVVQEEIKEFNPELKDGLKPKMKLWIPAASHVKKPEVKKETLVREEPVVSERSCSIALLLSLNIPKNISMDPSLADSAVIGESMDKETLSNLQFYEGSLSALDSLQKKHFKIQLHVYDTENDSLKTSLILKNPALKKNNFIVSNGNAVVSKMISDFSKTHSARFISCAPNVSDVLSSNKETISMLPSSLVQCFEMGKFSANKFSHVNCLVLKTPLARENDRSAAFVNGWETGSKEKVKEVLYLQDSVLLVKKALSKNADNLVFVPSSNEDFVSSLVNGLKEYSEEYRITIIGLPTWQYFETIDPLLLELFDVHIFSSSWIQLKDPVTMAFRKDFSDQYHTEPDEPAYLGFDAMMVAADDLINGHGKARESDSENILKGIYSSYRFEKNTSHDFFENHYISIGRYQDYELKKIHQ